RERKAEDGVEQQGDHRVDEREDHHALHVAADGVGDLVGDVSGPLAVACGDQAQQARLHRRQGRDEIEGQHQHDDESGDPGRDRRTDLQRPAADGRDVVRVGEELLDLGEQVLELGAELAFQPAVDVAVHEVLDHRLDRAREDRDLVDDDRHDQHHDRDQQDQQREDHDQHAHAAGEPAALQESHGRIESESGEEGEGD
ncbi:hypothetical protein ABE10_00895, partial [Bacillus toyonensis]|nr:hypothetical protein [Bacillus toyonensis]